jgi:hypothetical protein
MQNLPSINLDREVWGLTWNAAPLLGYGASGLAYCIGGEACAFTYRHGLKPM